MPTSVSSNPPTINGQLDGEPAPAGRRLLTNLCRSRYACGGWSGVWSFARPVFSLASEPLTCGGMTTVLGSPLAVWSWVIAFTI
jgi:hypothetical protein